MGLFNDYINKILDLPLWIKQTISLQLTKNLKTYYSNEFLNVREGEIFHLYQPSLSDYGLKELLFKESNLDEDMYKFLECCSKGMTLTEIAIENNFTMEEVAKAFIFCKSAKYFAFELPPIVNAFAGFISGIYKTGEYFVRSGKMTLEQLKIVLERQEELSLQGEHIYFAELLVKMGMVREYDIKSLIFLKEQAQKKFFINVDDIPSVQQEEYDIQNLRTEKTKLLEENEFLKQKINTILNFVRENKNNSENLEKLEKINNTEI